MRAVAVIILLITPLVAAVADEYFTATGEEDGNPLIFRGRQSIPAGVEESDYPFEMQVRWRFDASVRNGMPDERSNDAQITFEDALAELDGGEHSHLMLVVTGNGRKYWYWYAKNDDEWIVKLNELLDDHPAYPIEIHNSRDPLWSVYHDFMENLDGI